MPLTDELYKRMVLTEEQVLELVSAILDVISVSLNSKEFQTFIGLLW